jgi:hypothetical protein
MKADILIKRLEKLVKAKGELSIEHDEGGSGMGYYWSANIDCKWPWSVGSTFQQCLESLVVTHAKIDKEALQKKINEIDRSSAKSCGFVNSSKDVRKLLNGHGR